MFDRVLGHVALLENLLGAGLARGQVDLEAMTRVLQAFHHRPEAPLAPVPVDLAALSWALEFLPDDFAPADTLWVVDASMLDAGGIARIGPNEWARGGGQDALRRTALALAYLSMASVSLRQMLAHDDLLRDARAELALDRMSGGGDLGALAAPLALALGVAVEVVSEALRDDPQVLARAVRLAQAPFSATLRTRGVGGQTPNARAAGLWQELLKSLAALGADERPIAVWVGPLWVTDLVSPYAREVRPLLARWAIDNGLAALGEMITAGDEDAAYVCAELFCAADPAVQRERDGAEASAGVYTLSDPQGARMARLCDGERLDPAAGDSRLGRAGAPEGGSRAPLVVVLNVEDRDVEYALTRLLCDVRADFLGVAVCVPGLAAPGVEPPGLDAPGAEHLVASARAAAACHGPLLFAAPAAGLPMRRVLALPDLAYFAALRRSDEAWPAHEGLFAEAITGDFVWQQSALARALWRGDFPAITIEQRMWLEPAGGGEVLDVRRAHVRDALTLWRRWLCAPAPEDAAGEGSAKGVLARAKALQGGARVPPHRFRV